MFLGRVVIIWSRDMTRVRRSRKPTVTFHQRITRSEQKIARNYREAASANRQHQAPTPTLTNDTKLHLHKERSYIALREICQQWIHKISATDKRAVTHKARPRWLSVPAPKAFTCFTPFLCDISRQQRDLLVATEARLWVGPSWRFAQQVYSFRSS